MTLLEQALAIPEGLSRMIQCGNIQLFVHRPGRMRFARTERVQWRISGYRNFGNELELAAFLEYFEEHGYPPK